MSSRYIITDFDLFGGLHCETSAVRKVLNYNDLPISEEMLFGLGGGIGFIYWYVKQMQAPMVGGRGGGRYFIEDAARRVGVPLKVNRTASSKKGHTWLIEKLARKDPAVIYADMAYLPYMGVGENAHFGQHVFVVYGVDEKENVVYISDRAKRGVTVTLDELKKARASKFPPWPPQHAIFDFQLPKALAITKDKAVEAMQQTVDGMLNPPIRNIGLNGIEKWSKLIVKWPDLFPREKLLHALIQGFIYIETGGTGGSAFRPIYARYLQEISEQFSLQGLDAVISKYEEAARVLSEIATLLLPDEYPMLKRTREFILEQNHISEEQPPGATQMLNAMNQEFNSHIAEILVEVSQAAKFLPIAQDRILQLYQVEKEAIELLQNVSN